jgi:hypothetical protein
MSGANADIMNRLRLDCWRAGAWMSLPLAAEDGRYVIRQEGVTVSLALSPLDDGVWEYRLEVDSGELTRLRLTLEFPEVNAAFPIIPGVLFGDNNLEHAGPGHFPNLTTLHPDNVSCSPYWEFRADRASLPLSILCYDGGVAAVSIDPYTEQPGVPDGFIRNGVCARIGQPNAPQAIGVTLGYRNDPATFRCKDTWGAPTEHRLARGVAEGRIYLRPAKNRLAAHAIIRAEYERHRECPKPRLGATDAARAILEAFMEVCWSDELKDFTNKQTAAPGILPLKAWRPISEIGWCGGGPVGFPLLVAGVELGNEEAAAKGRWTLDRVAGCFNPASGLLWEVFNPDNGFGPTVDCWWSGYLVKGCHCAYTNGGAVSYLLEGYAWLREKTGEATEAWLTTACRVLDTMCKLQEPSGNFGYTYRTDRPEIQDSRGFAGVWFVPALAQAFELTGNKHYLSAAEKGFAYYRGFVRDLCCWGTPMDTKWAPDQEGVLGFIRAAALLHRLTGRKDYLVALGEGAEYEYLWRYGFRARPEAPPLKDSGWNSCGGSVTSVSNPCIHPMGLMVTRELRYLAERTGDDYHRQRMEDGLQWALNSLELYPGVMGYGRLGVLTERFCPTDAFLEERYPDGSPASIWFSYFAWAAANVLEGLISIPITKEIP